MLDFIPSYTGFLGLQEEDAGRPEEAGAVVMPFGLENTVGFEAGTSQGPRSIIEASMTLEPFDPMFGVEAYRRYGIATLKEPRVAMEQFDAIKQIVFMVDEAVNAGHFPLLIGGERSITIGAIRPFTQLHEEVTVLHFDAHASLHDVYEGDNQSHGCAMRRCLDHDNVKVVSVGVRNISSAEMTFYEENRDRVHIFWGHEMGQWDIADVIKAVGVSPTYITFGLDAFDSALMPATTMPEPGGLSWHDVMNIVAGVAKGKKMIGADIVDLAPRSGLHACNYIAAKLAYKIMSYALIK